MKNNILQITGFPEGGIGTHVLSLCKGLSLAYNISLVSNFDRQDNKFKNEFIKIKEKFSDITHLSIKKQPSLNDISNLYKLYQFYKDKNIDIIHGHGAKGGLYARILGLFLGSKVVYTPHGGSLHNMHGKIKGYIYILIEKALYYCTDKIVFESEYSKSIFINKVNSNPSKLIVNYNGVQFEKNVVIKKFDKNNVEIASFGLLRHLKGHDILIKAIEILVEKKYKINLIIYGEGEERENLENLIKDLKLEEKVLLFGFTNTPKKFMLMSDIIVHPSRFEALPYVPIEAMNLNIPVIASEVGGLREVISDNNGLLFKSECVECLVEKLEKLILNEDLRNRITKKGKSLVSKKFSEGIMLKNINIIYTKLIKTPKN